MIMLNRFVVPVLCLFYLFWSPHVFSVEKLDLDLYFTCNYDSELVFLDDIYGFEPDDEAQEIVEKILHRSGLEPNFRLMAANIPNAAAVVKANNNEGSDRIILYSQDFMERVKQRTRTDWAAISILAHEIGHHLQGHTLQAGGSRPSIELEADKYSGYVAAMLGGSLDDAQTAIKLLSSDAGSMTHPPKSARLAAITNGWKQAVSQINSMREVEQPLPKVESKETKPSFPNRRPDSYELTYSHVNQPSFNCSNAKKPVELLICFIPELSKADGIMGTIYRDLRKELGSSAADSLRNSQRQWIKDRDTACPVNAHDLNSPDHLERSALCLLSITEIRISELWVRLRNE